MSGIGRMEFVAMPTSGVVDCNTLAEQTNNPAFRETFWGIVLCRHITLEFIIVNAGAIRNLMCHMSQAVIKGWPTLDQIRGVIGNSLKENHKACLLC
jgi:hypothetical protein